MAMKGQRKYTGQLATPINELIRDDGQHARNYYELQRVEKFKALFEWYSIDPATSNAWRELAEKLALDHVPGMQSRPAPKKRGRSPSWKSGGLDAQLLRSVESIRKKKKTTIRGAIQILLRDPQWKNYTRSLETRYREARRTEQWHQRTYSEWKEARAGVRPNWLDAIIGDADEYFEWLRSRGFKIDEK